MIHKRTRYEDDEGFSYTFEPIEDTIKITETEGGFEVRYLVQDDNSESPDDWGDDNLFLVNYHRNFWIARDQIITKDQVVSWYREEGQIPQLEIYWIFSLSMFSHSGVWLYLGHTTPVCDPGGWDTSHVGIVLVAKEEWPELEKATEAARGLVESWNRYLSGDVYGCVKETFTKDKETIDHESCWGFYGKQYALEELPDFP
jgi:hypothetical protein